MTTLKTTSATILLKNINKINPSKSSKAYQYIMEVINGNTNIIRPCYTNGSGRNITIQDHTLSCTILLDKLKLKYEVANDAPRGGKVGTFIKITTKIK
jgi:hypothetical protein